MHSKQDPGLKNRRTGKQEDKRVEAQRWMEGLAVGGEQGSVQALIEVGSVI